MQRDYEVIRLIGQDSEYHIIMDFVSGESLGELVLQHPNIGKVQFFSWIMQVLKQLEILEKVTGNINCITPFYIVIKKDQSAALLNLNGEVNRKFLSKTVSNSIKKMFFTEEKDSIYSFGRTLQFLLAKSCLTPKLTWSEESKLRKIISKCLTNHSKKRYQNFSDIASDFPTDKKKTKKYKIWLFCILAGIGGFTMTQKMYDYWNTHHFIEEQKMYWDIGISYFLVFEDYDKSQTMFESIRNSQWAQYFLEMSSYMQGTSECTDMEMECILRHFCEAAIEELGPEERVCLVRVYNKIDTPYARRQVIELSEKLLRESIWEEGEKELREIRVNLFRREGEYERAVIEYEAFCERCYSQKSCEEMEGLFEKYMTSDGGQNWEEE